jgi:hypothetical protein
MELSHPPTSEGSAQAARFRACLGQMSVRGAQVVQLRLIGGLARLACAESFGISLQAFDIMLLRAARELQALVKPASSARAPRLYSQEVQQAEGLARQLEQGGPATGEMGALASILGDVQKVANEIRAQDATALLQQQTSPRHRRRVLLWRLFLLAIVGASLLLYLRPRSFHPIRVPPEQLR